MMTEDPDGAGQRSGVFRRVLVGFDGSNEARFALRVARSLAADIDGEVHVLFVLSPPAHAETTEETLAALDEERSRLAETLRMEQPVNGRDRSPISHVIQSDDPAEAISLFAGEHGFDLIVVGTHGQDRVMHRGAGRSLEKLIHFHPCPVLVV